MPLILRYLTVFLIFIAFLFPAALYPFQDYLRDLFGIAAVVLAILYIGLQRSKEFAVPVSLSLVFAIGATWLLNYLLLGTDAVLATPYYNYLIIFVLAVTFLVSVKTLAVRYGYTHCVIMFARLLVVIGVCAAFIALSRYYGVLKLIVPVISQDGSRLLGPMGQPNLMAVLMALSSSALIFLRLRGGFRNSSGFYSVLLLLFSCGFLTISRSWYIFSALLILFVAYSSFYLGAKGSVVTGKRFFYYTLVCWLLLLLLVPKVDGIISAPLIESGFVNRQSAEEMIDARLDAESSGRLNEWRKALENLDKVENLWLGNGLGRYGDFSNRSTSVNDEYALPMGKAWNNAHNILITILIEWGIVGLLVFSAFLAYVFVLIYKSASHINGAFLALLVLIFVSHSLLEFSLWYMPYFFIFLASLALLDRYRRFSLPSRVPAVSIAVLLFVGFALVGFYVARDVKEVLRITYSEKVDSSDLETLENIARSPLIGHKAMSIKILKFMPPLSNLQDHLSDVSRAANWRPEPLFVMRQATLSAAVAGKDLACSRITRAVELYPGSAGRIQEELGYFSRNRIVHPGEFRHCILKGLSFWREQQ